MVMVMVTIIIIIIIITVLSVGCMNHLNAENQGNNNIQHFQSIATPLMLRYKHNMCYLHAWSVSTVVKCILKSFSAFPLTESKAFFVKGRHNVNVSKMINRIEARYMGIGLVYYTRPQTSNLTIYF